MCYIDLHASAKDPAEFASVMTETAALAKVHAHIERMSCDTLQQVDVFLSPRVPLDAEPCRHPGWLEWLLVYQYQGCKNKLTVGMIQRTPDAEFEFHS